MRFRKAMLLLAFMLLLAACGQETDSMERRITKRCREIAAMYQQAYQNASQKGALRRSDIDAMETVLIDADLDVLDTSEEVPDYLTTGDRFRSFWNCVQRGEDGEQEVLKITESGNLSYVLFTYQNGKGMYFFAQYDMESGEVTAFETQEILDWELTERGHFYYQIYSADHKHYADYLLLRLDAPDPEMAEMTRKYIEPVGYVAVNLFLCDWQEGAYGELSINDLWENMYYSRYGEQYRPETDSRIPQTNIQRIPAAEFEEILRPYFHMDLETFRELAAYEEDGDFYPWRSVETEDFVKLQYYNCTPEVTAWEQNPDGTITMTVEVLSTDLKLDCLFFHEVTVRPLADGGFQYVGNRVTSQTEYGLPYCVPRLEWE